ncbi:hypothetical protein E2P81_ATG02420 [Venturia nashicola]|uniref:DUF7704 domain-containing protein n=1 Tax=Venturia nashicola TaxID=86259 RepID=A0A4Z1PNZ2_9PEZI|nr:hypothetical protein E6O75_ATG02479 [Venturia nashicola]TLD36638.1 hypothetical protein E2P81_ATG02420 [Venturia nashicola]
MPDPAISPFYTFFFLYIEPISTIIGAYFAHCLPSTYLLLTHPNSAPSPDATLPITTTVTLSQLANLYLLFALNEGLVLRATHDLRVWRTLLFGLLVADFGHLYSVKDLGHATYWQFWTWNPMGWGNVGFVYMGAMTRVAFLLGFGVERADAGPEKGIKSR